MLSTCPTRSLPERQTAVMAQGLGKLAIQQYKPIHPLSPDTVFVKTAAVAINLADAKTLGYSPAAGAILGHDFRRHGRPHADFLLKVPQHMSLERRPRRWGPELPSLRWLSSGTVHACIHRAAARSSFYHAQ
ncbi:uncharacterized protein YNL134C [Aspergillus udagawae]|uniref:Uncharacterized protein YNL134C n=1 Tax=Aspergillus udagawae TaxID=91492 RepID=A0ABQ1BAF3_9EURO|nr:uncharacterized protein YNL134C [Aspergillus udagawae]GFF97364.1 uncharacterized protein YNL134C [Aspergillus udagawae]